jgi:6-phosphogluconolactonase
MRRRFLVGTYTTQRSARGVYLCALDERGRIDVLDVCACADPSFVVLHPRLPLAYAVNESPSGHGGISIIEVGEAGLSLRETIETPGRLPCHLAVLRGGAELAVAHYGCGTLAVFGLAGNGSLSGNPQVWRHAGAAGHSPRQASAHPHCVVAAGAHLYVTDLGQDRIVCYVRRAAWREQSSCVVHAGAGPRHLCVDAAAGVAWLANELDNTVSRLEIGGDGAMREHDWTRCLPVQSTANSAVSEIARHPSGRWLYVANRGHDSIVRFAIGARGRLDRCDAVSTQGRHPRHFAIAADGERLLVANRDSDTLVAYAIDQRDGSLRVVAEPSAAVPAPVCVCWLASSGRVASATRHQSS